MAALQKRCGIWAMRFPEYSQQIPCDKCAFTGRRRLVFHMALSGSLQEVRLSRLDSLTLAITWKDSYVHKDVSNMFVRGTDGANF